MANSKACETLPEADDKAIEFGKYEQMQFDGNDAEAFLEALGLPAEQLEFRGESFPLAESKDDLVVVPIVVLDWQFGFSSSYGVDYVQVRAVRMDAHEKLTIFDTGAGIYRSLS